MKIPVVKEHGSWAVFILAGTAGITAAFLTRPWQRGREFSVITLLTVAGMALLINSKSPLSAALRPGGQVKKHFLWFVFFSVTGLVLLVPFLARGGKQFLFFSPLVLSYVILLWRGKEHHFLAELNGFALLTLSAPIIYFVITGDMSVRLYLAVFIFFAAGVFKVRARAKKTPGYRLLMVLYCAASPVLYHFLNIPAVLLIPLVENVVSVLRLREEKLRTTGNTELIKGVVFTALLGFFW
ncbi:hypothetical protein BMS3Abin10_01359 [bacterium BMS3Abin10]|nr:hypothetical protein BMS3Abin10_01359 [bacterium BMS3Abin10]GBE40085.1 hypothetical protein BMS3Bbin08_02723 [bacterium BMS3Bbin08]HDH51002.1 hypothetical protein [Nitrospirota bacterium]HDK17430.1 hypothetical protein [Nitrospirota bacterium]HDK41435.1 hypothetical protein [Nitrospirota bacterium]